MEHYIEQQRVERDATDSDRCLLIIVTCFHQAFRPAIIMAKGMECIALRESSFTSKKRTKWPHSSKFLATPLTLAEAGFHHAPSAGAKDNVACFKCQKNIGEWEEDDDPFELHWQKCGRNGACAWAVVRCSPDLEFKNKYGVLHAHVTLFAQCRDVDRNIRIQRGILLPRLLNARAMILSKSALAGRTIRSRIIASPPLR